MVGGGRLSLHTSQVAHQAGAYPGFRFPVEGGLWIYFGNMLGL